MKKRGLQSLHIRTVATILAWFVVALLLLNGIFRSEWILPISIVLTCIALVIYFIPRLRKTEKPEEPETNKNGKKQQI
jgi:hypothetical protein